MIFLLKQRVSAPMSLGEGAFRRKYLTGVPVLKKLTVAFVSVVKTDRITGQQSSHQRGDPPGAGAKQKVGMIGHQNPGVTKGLCFRHKSGQTADKIFLIGCIGKYLFAFNPTDNDVMQHTGSI